MSKTLDNSSVKQKANDPQIPAAMDRLRKSIEVLSETIGNLESRLKPVLQQVPVKDETKALIDTGGTAPLAVEIAEQTAVVNFLKEWIGSILSCLEL